MALITLDGNIVPDPWQARPEDTADAGGRPPLRHYRPWQQFAAGEVPAGARLGVILQPDDPIKEVIPWLDRLDLIALNFPRAGDGRPYSLARQLRWRYGFSGELRANGHVQSDQLDFMRRCGFSTFSPSHEDADKVHPRHLHGPRAYPRWQDPARSVRIVG